jgi:hypothetical protein
MSRGYGELQWRLLKLLSEHERAGPHAARTDRGLDTLTLAQRVHEREPTRSELVSVRRALATLKRDGKVRYFMLYERRHYWVSAEA